MSLDFPATGTALWTLSDTTGIRPEYALVVMDMESGLDPGAVNSIGCVGLNQMCPSAHNIPPGYSSWPASRQISQVIGPFWEGIVSTYGPIRSGARLMQANFLPASLALDVGLDDVIATATDPSWGFGPGVVYRSNPALDPQHTGRITLRTIAQALTPHARSSRVRNYLRMVYDMRPDEVMTDPILGTELTAGQVYGRPFPWGAVAAAAVILGAGAAASYAIARAKSAGVAPRRARRIVRFA